MKGFNIFQFELFLITSKRKQMARSEFNAEEIYQTVTKKEQTKPVEAFDEAISITDFMKDLSLRFKKDYESAVQPSYKKWLNSGHLIFQFTIHLEIIFLGKVLIVKNTKKENNCLQKCLK